MSITGSLMGHMITAVIEGHTLTSDLDVPSNRNGEATAVDIATNVYVLKYLQETGQLTSNVTQRLHQNIETGMLYMVIIF